MSLPWVAKATECAEYSRVVAPYLHQCQPFAQSVYQSISDPVALRQIYLDTNPMISAFAFSVISSSIFLVVSEANRNYSQVDRMWSILPTLYNLHYTVYAHLSGLNTQRLDALMVVSTIWSTRLSFNYWRKGGYSVGSEDYRWEILRKYINPFLFFIFNVVFISLAQSVLLFLVTTPTYLLVVVAKLARFDSDKLAWSGQDIIIAAGMVTLVLLTFLGDQQQWDYQQAKAQYRKTAQAPRTYKSADLDRGFITSGLWARSRHPNFTTEQLFWVTLYLWGCFTTRTWYNWTAVGAVAYLCLFQASTWFTELISARKYPEYKQYQQQVGKFLPTSWNNALMWTGPEHADGATEKAKEDDAAKARERYDLR